AYTFYLRKGVRFHHGRELTAEDFVYTFTRVLSPETRSSSSDFFTKIEGARDFMEGRKKKVAGLVAPDRYTLKILLSEPYAPFISILAMKGAKVVPKEVVEQRGIEFGKTPIGTGPFKFRIKSGEEIVLEANDDYFEGRPYLDKIVFKIFHGSPREKILKEFRKGNLEESFLPPEELGNLELRKSFLFVQKPTLSLRFYGLNLKSELLGNKNLRKAINFAIDKQSIISEIHKDQFHLAKAILPPGMPGYDPQRNPYPHDGKKAEEFLVDAEYRKNQGNPPLEIWCASNSAAAQNELNAVKSQLKAIGIESEILYETHWPIFESMLREDRAPVFVYAWYADFPDPDNFLGILFHSKSKYNYTGYQNPLVDRLLEEAKREKDYLKRMETYRKIEGIILEDAPIVPLVNHLLQLIYQPYVRGIQVNALGGPYVPMKKIWFKKE
ncbi:MAG: hypothetical protein A2162_00840, partial [Deltaproteobacteria bacterium RBG_13_52_11b]